MLEIPRQQDMTDDETQQRSNTLGFRASDENQDGVRDASGLLANLSVGVINFVDTIRPSRLITLVKKLLDDEARSHGSFLDCIAVSALSHYR